MNREEQLAAENEALRAQLREMALDVLAASGQAQEAYEAQLAAEAERDALRDALRLIELIGYREGEQFGWINAHMRGVATSALTGGSLEHYWRLFPRHRSEQKEQQQ